MRVSRLFKQKLKNNHQVNDLKIDSREIIENDVFFAIRGERFDGQDFIVSAIAKGAKTIVSDRPWSKSELFSGINFIIVEDVEKTLAETCLLYTSRLCPGEIHPIFPRHRADERSSGLGLYRDKPTENFNPIRGSDCGADA